MVKCSAKNDKRRTNNDEDGCGRVPRRPPKSKGIYAGGSGGAFGRFQQDGEQLGDGREQPRHLYAARPRRAVRRDLRRDRPRAAHRPRGERKSDERQARKGNGAAAGKAARRPVCRLQHLRRADGAGRHPRPRRRLRGAGKPDRLFCGADPHRRLGGDGGGTGAPHPLCRRRRGGERTAGEAAAFGGQLSVLAAAGGHRRLRLHLSACLHTRARGAELRGRPARGNGRGAAVCGCGSRRLYHRPRRAQK